MRPARREFLVFTTIGFRTGAWNRSQSIALYDTREGVDRMKESMTDLQCFPRNRRTVDKLEIKCARKE